MKGVVRSAPCAAVRFGAQVGRNETPRSIRRAERLVLQSHVHTLDSATRYRTPPFSSKLPDLAFLAQSVTRKQHNDGIKTCPKSPGTMVRLPFSKRFIRYINHVNALCTQINNDSSPSMEIATASQMLLAYLSKVSRKGYKFKTLKH